MHNLALFPLLISFTALHLSTQGALTASQEKEAPSPPSEQSENENANDKAAEPDEDNGEISASELNARQRINQTVTVRRSINGVVVEEKSVSVPDNLNLPKHQSEASTTITEVIRAQADREVLTRREVLSEANLDFTLADTNSDQQITREEFSKLWLIWRDDENYKNVNITPTDDNDNSIDWAITKSMGEKFIRISGIEGTLSRKDYIVEVLHDFDAMDADGDYILQKQELANFRKISVGLKTQ